MPEIPREVIEHKLDIDSSFKSIKQKERRYTTERRETTRQEVNRLLKAGFIRPVDYPSWRMCIDYTSLNKVCPKDEYPLPCICQIIDSTSSCELLSFLNAYSSYHQISLAINDEGTGLLYEPRRRTSMHRRDQVSTPQLSIGGKITSSC
jgi:hypothetical protein